MKLAIMLAGMASGNKIARDPTQLLAQGARLVQSSPQLSALSDHARARLLEAGKGIAVAVVSRQMESLSDRLGERTERLSGRLDERVGSLAVRPGRFGRAADEADPDDADHADEQADEDGTDQVRAARQGAQPRPRRTTAGRTASQRGGANSPRKRNIASSATNDSGNATGGPARSRIAGGLPRGERNA